MHAQDVIPLFLPIMKSLGLLHINMGELIDGLTVAPVANIPVTVYPDQIMDYTRQILEHNTGEEVIMNYFDQESRQSGRDIA